jgi:hypothetical protein
MNVVAEAMNIQGLIVYLVGMILIGGAMKWGNYIDDRRGKRRQARAHRHCDDGPSATGAPLLDRQSNFASAIDSE